MESNKVPEALITICFAIFEGLLISDLGLEVNDAHFWVYLAVLTVLSATIVTSLESK